MTQTAALFKQPFCVCLLKPLAATHTFCFTIHTRGCYVDPQYEDTSNISDILNLTIFNAVSIC